MRTLHYIVLLLILSGAALNSYGQVTKSDLYGEWVTNNSDSVYYHSDTVELHLDINHFVNSKTCDIIKWRLNAKSFKLVKTFLCTEPGRESSSTDKERLTLWKTDFGQIVELKRNGKTIDKFKILDYEEKEVDRYPYDIKTLKLLRFDNLADQQLYKYIDSLIYKVLQYDSTMANSGNQHLVDNNSVPTGAKIIIRDEYDSNPEPLIVLNGHVVEDKNILKEFLLVEAKAISYLTKEQATSLYGTRARNGVIVLQVSNSKFRKKWKINGG